MPAQFEEQLSQEPARAKAASDRDVHAARSGFALLENEMPLPKSMRLLGVSLSSLQSEEQEESQLGLPI